MRYCFCAFLFASVLAADERFTTRLGTQAVDFIGGIGHSSDGTHPVEGIRLRGGLARYFSGYGEFTYSRIQRDAFFVGGNNGDLKTSLIDINGGLEVHGSGLRLSPYGFAGLGLLRRGTSAELLGQKAEASLNKLAGSFGFGLRMFVTPRWGFSAEAKGLKAVDHDWIGRYALGVFLTFPPKAW